MIIQSLLEFINEKKAFDLVDDSETKRKKRAKRIKIEFNGMKHRLKNKRIKTLLFSAIDPMGSTKTRNMKIRIPDFSVISRMKKLSTKEKLEYIVDNGDIQVYCDCPDFLYKGYKWMADTDNYGIEKEIRPPNIRNPNLEGAFCKHLIAAFDKIDEYYEEISTEIDRFNRNDSKSKRKEKS